jgi:hypothetical protein
VLHGQSAIYFQKRKNGETQTENYLVEKLILATEAIRKFGKCFKILVTQLSVRSLPHFQHQRFQNKRITRSCGTGYRNRKDKLTSTGPLLITHWEWAAQHFETPLGACICMTKLSVYHFRKLVEWWRHADVEKTKDLKEHAKKSVSKKSPKSPTDYGKV